ncbi:MAG: GNAT family N-acetyltransferase [Rhodobacteraceae bacterium]|nr:GNAT family N-acetyltransferase [Paracoccaceae bacterium]
MTLAFTIPVLETDRLILLEPREADFPAMLAFNDSPRAAFLGGSGPRQQVWRAFLSNIGHWALRGYGFWSVDTKAGDLIGRVGVIFHDGWVAPELAWHLYEGFEGKGYAHEAALASRDWAAGQGMAPLVSMIDPANTRSIALATRLGARLERTDPGGGKPFHIFRHPLGGTA